MTTSTTIMSAVQAIDALRFVSVRTGVVKDVEKAIALDKYAMLLKFKNGSYHVTGNYTSLRGNCALMGFGENSNDELVLTGLVKIGAITKEQKEQHMKIILQRNKRRKKEQSAKCFKSLCADIGIENIQAMIEEMKT